MKLKWFLLIALFGGALLAPLLLSIPGSTYIVLDTTAISFNNGLAATVLFFGVLVLFFVWKFVRYLLRTSNLTLGWFGDRGLRKARQNTIDGMIALAEGHWKTAEGLLVKGAKIDDTKLINYLAAARAAQEQGLDDRRDVYLKRAAQAQPAAQVAVGLTQAQLQLRSKQFEQALATLNHLRQLSPHHPYVLSLLMTLHTQLGEWQNIIDLMPKFRKNRVAPSRKLDQLEIDAWHNLLLNSNQNLEQMWLNVPKSVKMVSKIAECRATFLLSSNRMEEAELCIKDSLKREWNTELAYLFGNINSEKPSKTLASAEAWLKSKPNNPTLLLSLGKLALKAELWGKAKSFLEQAQTASSEHKQEICWYLAKAQEALGHPLQAQEMYQQGLESTL